MEILLEQLAEEEEQNQKLPPKAPLGPDGQPGNSDTASASTTESSIDNPATTTAAPNETAQNAATITSPQVDQSSSAHESSTAPSSINHWTINGKEEPPVAATT